MKHCKLHVHERAAQPKHMTILDELPKTAVGKVFKPDLRKRAITRVVNATLEEAGLNASVVDVVEDKKRGLVAQILTDAPNDPKLIAELDRFALPWDAK
jgi:fatty-acyl-CoA synthase/long-chain acyl-CoA synthetase